jgi:hypothetical protein
MTSDFLETARSQLFPNGTMEADALKQWAQRKLSFELVGAHGVVLQHLLRETSKAKALGRYDTCFSHDEFLSRRKRADEKTEERTHHGDWYQVINAEHRPRVVKDMAASTMVELRIDGRYRVLVFLRESFDAAELDGLKDGSHDTYLAKLIGMIKLVPVVKLPFCYPGVEDVVAATKKGAAAVAAAWATYDLNEHNKNIALASTTCPLLVGERQMPALDIRVALMQSGLVKVAKPSAAEGEEVKTKRTPRAKRTLDEAEADGAATAAAASTTTTTTPLATSTRHIENRLLAAELGLLQQELRGRAVRARPYESSRLEPPGFIANFFNGADPPAMPPPAVCVIGADTTTTGQLLELERELLHNRWLSHCRRTLLDTALVEQVLAALAEGQTPASSDARELIETSLLVIGSGPALMEKALAMAMGDHNELFASVAELDGKVVDGDNDINGNDALFRDVIAMQCRALAIRNAMLKRAGADAPSVAPFRR